MKYEIVKGIEFSQEGPGRPPRYPFNSMDVGDAFMIPDEEVRSARASAWRFGRRRGMKFGIQKTPGGYYCKRLA